MSVPSTGEPSAKRTKSAPRGFAYLGPPGTYGHQAALAFSEKLSCSVELEPCATIPSIYTSPAPFLVMPLQNTIHGPVLDTVDALLSALSSGSPASSPFGSAAAGPSETSKANGHGESSADAFGSVSASSAAFASPSSAAFASPSSAASASRPTLPRIVGMLDLPIRHCLVVKKGTKMGDIKWVRSHEQALGQSSIFLAHHLPHAKQITYPSTAGAALSLISPGSDGANGDSNVGHTLDPLDPLGAGATIEDRADVGQGTGAGAAICSKAVVALHGDELEVLWEGTQAVDDNYTRFLLLTRLPHPELTATLPTLPTLPTVAFSPNQTQFIHSLHTSHSSSSSYFALSDASQLADLVKSYHIVNVHSRPAPVSTPSSLSVLSDPSATSAPSAISGPSATSATSAAPALLPPSAGRIEDPRRDRFPTYLLVEARPIVDREKSDLAGTQGNLVPLGTAGMVVDPS